MHVPTEAQAVDPVDRRNRSTGRRLSAKGAEKRREIVDAAAELFATNGFRGTGIIEVAKRVGLSHVGLLHHFGTKENLLRAVVEDRDARQADYYVKLRGLRGSAALLKMNELSHLVTGPNPFNQLFLVLIAENLQVADPLNEYFRIRYASSRQFFADAVRTGQEDGEFRPDADPCSVGAQAMGLLIGGALQKLTDPDGVDLVRCYSDFTDRLIADLRL